MSEPRVFIDYLLDMREALADMVWQTLIEDLPPLEAQIDAVIQPFRQT